MNEIRCLEEEADKNRLILVRHKLSAVREIKLIYFHLQLGESCEAEHWVEGIHYVCERDYSSDGLDVLEAKGIPQSLTLSQTVQIKRN